MCHIDHTQLDVFVRRRDGVTLIGKPWISLAIDACTRLILAIWVSMLAPSAAGCLIVLRDLVRRHGRLPLYVITDGGRDFTSTAVQQFLASHRCGWGQRPSSEPRFGNPVERINLDISEQYSRTVYGSNRAFHTPRTASRTHDPRDFIYHDLRGVAIELEKMLFEVYPNRPHAGLNETPQNRLRTLTLTQGAAWGIPVRFDEMLIYQTLAQAHKHGGLIRQKDGFRLNGHNYFSAEMVGEGGRRMADKPLYDLEDPTYACARIGNQFVNCPILDSQAKRLPPGDRRYYLSEQIYLAKPSSKRMDTDAYTKEMGRMYLEMERNHQAESERLSKEKSKPARARTPATQDVDFKQMIRAVEPARLSGGTKQ
jgi:putative transposase